MRADGATVIRGNPTPGSPGTPSPRVFAVLAKRETRRRWLLVPLVLLAASLAPACRGKSDPVKALLGRVEAAAEKRDADGIAAELADEFQASDGESRAELLAGLRRLMAGYDSLSVSVSDLTAERGTGLAHVTFRAALAGTPRALGGAEAFLPRAATYRFDLRLVERDGRYRITKAAWERE
ncbi:MAG: nuclear transport factor 2 family protein [Thermoanaerobaculia bacterium]